MFPLTRDYRWLNGLPQATDRVDEQKMVDELSVFRFVTDSYQTRITIERYRKGEFAEVAYDSILLDFRKMTPEHQAAWRKEPIRETPTSAVYLIRDETDRPIFFEQYKFEDQRCRSCFTTSVHGIFLCEQKMYYTALGDLFDGVVLYDRLDHPVMYKRYEATEGGLFGEIIDEQWDMNQPPPI